MSSQDQRYEPLTLCCVVLYLALKPLRLQSDAFARTNTSYNAVESIVVVVFYWSLSKTVHCSCCSLRVYERKNDQAPEWARAFSLLQTTRQSTSSFPLSLPHPLSLSLSLSFLHLLKVTDFSLLPTIRSGKRKTSSSTWKENSIINLSLSLSRLSNSLLAAALSEKIIQLFFLQTVSPILDVVVLSSFSIYY